MSFECVSKTESINHSSRYKSPNPNKHIPQPLDHEEKLSKFHGSQVERTIFIKVPQ